MSPSLGRQAVYSLKARMSRLPTYLTVHMVRFAWREDIGKKAKIMVRLSRACFDSHFTDIQAFFVQRKVKFPLEFDALDLATEELREKLIPASRKLKDIEKDRGERRKVRKRTKQAVPAAAAPVVSPTVDVEMADAVAVTASAPADAAAAVPAAKEAVPDFEDEVGARTREAEELKKLIPQDIMNDVGCSATGLYDLVGASLRPVYVLNVGCLPITRSNRHPQRCCRRCWALHGLREEERARRVPHQGHRRRRHHWRWPVADDGGH